ncbi:hypothetical protein DBR11_16885, partial [Pedobacter sp. HMWF019]|uniref:hypothetical protein n=1 Tax=Pedobacter sp. HMWF019 TaxID=2056856 RepID=UPI000D475494
SVLYSCAQSNVSNSSERDYQEAMGFFRKSFINHFPVKKNGSGNESSMFSAKSEKKNDFNLLLYQYNVNQDTIYSVLKKIRDKAIAEYKPTDSCLLIVNRFETAGSKDSLEIPIITDSTLINRDCYNKKYPVPNFIGSHQNIMNRDFRLDDSFTIYVLDAKKVDSWGTEFALGPDPQMPNNWKNGYSKGVAISKKKQTVIYWTVIW